MVAYGREHGEQLNALPAGSLIVISTGSVYADDEGRALDGVSELPRLPFPIPETQRTAEPGDTDNYSRGKAALEEERAGRAAADDACCGRARSTARARSCRASCTSSSALSTVGDASRSRGEGKSHFHTVSAENIAELIRLAAANARATVSLNAGDPDPPTTLEICHAIGAAMGHEFEPVLLPGDEFGNPWGLPPDAPVRRWT